MKQRLNTGFWRYVLPSMFAMLLSGFYSIVDGLFVGNAVGNAALAAINIAYPIQILLNACALGLGIGGAVMMTFYRGCQNEVKSRQSLQLTVLLLLITGVLLSAILYISAPVLVKMLGAQGETYELAMQYIAAILAGGLLPVLGNGLNPLIRNNGKTIAATVCMSSGLIVNIILDYLFVFRMGMGLRGAALATLTAQGTVTVTALLCLGHKQFWGGSRIKDLIDLSLVKQIIQVGFSPFGQTLVPCIVIILTNYICLQYGGDDAVTVYSVISYVLASAQLLLQGIGDGTQPLLSFYHGGQGHSELRWLYQKAFFLSLTVAVFLCVSCFLFAPALTALFGISSDLFMLTETALLITALSFPFIAITRLTSAFFYATGKNRNATFLVYLEPCCLLPLFLISFSSSFGLSGIWAAYPAAQIVLCVCALVLKSPNLETVLEKTATETKIHMN